MSTLVTILTTVTAISGGVGVARALIGPIRGKRDHHDGMERIQRGVAGLSLLVIALFVAAPVGLFGAWFLTLALATVLALVRPEWMVRGRTPGRITAGALYLGLTLGAAVLGMLADDLWGNGVGAMGRGMGGAMSGGAYASGLVDGWLADVVALGSLLLGRAWLWFWRKDAPFATLGDPDAAKHEPASDAPSTGKGSVLWWDRIWRRYRPVADSESSGSSAFGATAPHGDDRTATDTRFEDSRSGHGGDAKDRRTASAHQTKTAPLDADASLQVPGYDTALLGEELAAFRAHIRLIDRVALTWPDHPVAEALIHVSVILNETRRYLQDHPAKYRDLRPILVGHASTAADIAGLVERIKGTGETLDDSEGVARRLFALASLMRETRRKSTRVERDRLQASMAVIDAELNDLSAMRAFRDRVAQERDGVGTDS